MKWSQLGFIGRRVRNSVRDLFWTHLLTSVIMALTLFVFGAFMLLQENLEALLKGWGDQLQINAYVGTELSGADIEALQERIRMYPEVARVRHISQEQAWTDFQAALGAQANVLEGLPRNVLPASFEISLRPSFRDGPLVEALAARLKKEKGITSVEYAQDWVDRISLVVLAVQWAKWILGGVLFLTTYFIVNSTVKLAMLARKEEIEIMELVGASRELIEAPFVLEGMIQGTVAGALSVGGLWIAFEIMRNQVPLSFGVLGFTNPLQFLGFQSVALIMAIGCVLGAAGSLFALRRFLRSWQA
ncbi:MAG: cell division protein FtsX [Alphaproteobacteria bacterium]